MTMSVSNHTNVSAQAEGSLAENTTGAWNVDIKRYTTPPVKDSDKMRKIEDRELLQFDDTNGQSP